MIKKIIACLTICFIITGIISPVFSDASALPQPNWSDPGISEIINISDLTGWMLNGGTFDVSTYTDAESFMNDYYSARTKTKLVGSDYTVKHYYGIEELYYDVGDSAYVHPLDVNRAISSAFRDHVGYGRRFSEQVNNALLSTGNFYDTKIPLLNEVEFANFVNYNHDALRLYNEFFENNVPSPSPTPEPDPNYSYISNINYCYVGNKDFFTSRFVKESDSNYTLTPNVDLSTISIISNSNIQHTNNNQTNVNTFLCCLAPQYTISVSSGSPTTVTYSANSSIVKIFNEFTGNMINVTNSSGTDYLMVSNYPFNPNTNFTTSFNNLSNALQYIYNTFCGINLYVDGVLWASPGNNIVIPSITPEFPDAVGGEDLPSTTWPVHRPLAPYFITAPGMLQAIQDAIDDDGYLDIDDLKPYLTDENGDPVTNPQFDPEPVPLPVPDPVNPDVVPGLPVLPSMPLEMPGFSGVSVLAEIINFTNQSLPTSLIVTFWGIVFGIVILGLIKILHK